MRAFVSFVAVLAVVFTAGCAQLGIGPAPPDLTPKQKVFDLMTKYEAAQVVALRVVQDPKTPDSVKTVIKIGSHTTLVAILNYEQAIRNGEPNLADYANAAVRGLAEFTSYMITMGFMDAKTTSGVPATARGATMAAGFFYEKVLRT